ncbi:MAG: hypothetical protein WD688_07775 [Candidatus Binatia bacterium]
MANSDSSEFARHLRTVHFSLVLACSLVLLSQLISSSSDAVTTAHEQLRFILNVKTDWSNWTRRFVAEQVTWLKNNGKSWPDTVHSTVYIVPSELTRENVPTVDKAWQVELFGSPVFFTAVAGDYKDNQPEIVGRVHTEDYGWQEVGGGYDSDRPSFLNTLEDFRRFWDHANYINAFVVTELSKVAYITTDGIIKAKLSWTHERKTAEGMSTSLTLGGHWKKYYEKCPIRIHELFKSQLHGKFNNFFCGEPPGAALRERNYHLVLPAVVLSPTPRENLRLWLSRAYGFRISDDKFEKSFPELNEVTRHYQKLEMTNVNSVLQAELERAGERIEFLGLRVPEREISTWGAFIIIVIQYYFWLHLRVLHLRLSTNKNDSAFNVAWIGLYTDWWAVLVLLISVSVLPIVIFYIAGFFALSWRLIPLAFGLILAFDSFRFLWKVRQLNQEGHYSS